MYLGFKPPCLCGLEYPEQWWNILPARTAAWRKQAKLLHGQLMDKHRAFKQDFANSWKTSDEHKLDDIIDGTDGRLERDPNAGVYNHPTFGKIYTVTHYDIKDPSKDAYNPNDPFGNALGLNQYFVGQSPYKPYDGDPGDDDGIYHDKSEIIQYGKRYDSSVSLEKLASGNVNLPVKMREKDSIYRTNKNKPLYEMNLISLIEHKNTNYNADGVNISMEYSIYACDNGSIYIVGNDSRVLYLNGFDEHPLQTDENNRLIAPAYDGFELLTFYAEGEMKDQPTNLRRFNENWNEYYKLDVKEDMDAGAAFIGRLLSVVGVVVMIFGFNTGGFIGIGSALGGFALSLTGYGMAIGDKDLMNFAKGVGLIGSVFSFVGAIKNLVGTIGNTAAANASPLSSAGTASKMGLEKTSELYIGTGAMNASGKGASMTFSELLKQSDMSFKDALNTTITGIEPVEKSFWESLKQTLSSGFKSFSDAKDVFKSSGDYSDDEMPTNEDKKTAVAIRQNGNLKHYKTDNSVDMGLDEGSLMYLKKPKFNAIQSQPMDANLWEVENGKVLPLVKIKKLNIFDKKAKTKSYYYKSRQSKNSLKDVR